MNFYYESLKLAKKVKNLTIPNPAVGAVLIKNDKIIGKGATSAYPGPHAELNALKSVKDPKKIPGSTLYVTLQPCCHFGNTPPCTDLIIQHNIKKVIIGTRDPNPTVFSKSDDILKKKGIIVEYSYPEKIINELREINEDFFKFISTNEPFIAAKYAMTLDGKIATAEGDSKWITSEKSLNAVHQIRSRYQSIAVGSNTILNDDPLLTIRHNIKTPFNYYRIIIDPKGDTPANSRVLLTPSKTLIITSDKASAKFIKIIKEAGKDLEIFPLKNQIFDLKKIFKIICAKYNIHSIFIEGGSHLLGSALQQQAIDKLYTFIGNKLTGDSLGLAPFSSQMKLKKMNHALTLKKITFKQFDEDIMIKGYLKEYDYFSK